ncbi:MAG: sulfurtransferase-like selenium metabolism protein YedF [Thermodesulfovibrionales bacterium]
MQIDARGKACPQPLLLAEEALSRTGDNVIEVLVDNYDAAENIRFFAQRNGWSAQAFLEGNAWRIRMVKQASQACATAQTDAVQCRPISRDAKDILVVIATDSLGKDEALGRMLMKGFFETMKVTKETPRVLFFVNAGVRITTLSSEIISVLKELEAMGVEIYSCGTCLKYFELEDSLQVGRRGSTNTVVENMVDRAKTVWIG